MYTHILTPLDGSRTSEQVLPYVRSLAGSLSLPITLLLSVEPEHPSVGQILNPTLRLYETHFHRASHAQAYLERIAGPLREEGLSVITTVPHREPSVAIVEGASHCRESAPDHPVSCRTSSRPQFTGAAGRAG